METREIILLKVQKDQTQKNLLQRYRKNTVNCLEYELTAGRYESCVTKGCH